MSMCPMSWNSILDFSHGASAHNRMMHNPHKPSNAKQASKYTLKHEHSCVILHITLNLNKSTKLLFDLLISVC